MVKMQSQDRFVVNPAWRNKGVDSRLSSRIGVVCRRRLFGSPNPSIASDITAEHIPRLFRSTCGGKDLNSTPPWKSIFSQTESSSHLPRIAGRMKHGVSPGLEYAVAAMATTVSIYQLDHGNYPRRKQKHDCLCAKT